MFVTFFHELKAAGVPVTLREYLTLMEAMEHDLAGRRVEDFYYLSRATLIKDERNLDRFDRVFGHVFKGLELLEQALTAEIPSEWLKELDGEVALGTRNIKIALRRLRKFARTGAPDELDLDGTIKGTAHKGYLDILMRPERHNAVKVLLFFDVGGSMDWHIKATEELFSAARSEFKHMEHFYFHNCLYEKVWEENRRRFDHTVPTSDALHTYPHDYKVIFVGDASMSPYEIMAPGGSVEHFNEEAGAAWIERVARTYPACVWLNPVAEKEWDYTQSIRIMRQLMGGRMYPLTLEGLDKAMRELVR